VVSEKDKAKIKPFERRDFFFKEKRVGNTIPKKVKVLNKKPTTLGGGICTLFGCAHKK